MVVTAGSYTKPRSLDDVCDPPKKNDPVVKEIEAAANKLLQSKIATMQFTIAADVQRAAVAVARTSTSAKGGGGGTLAAAFRGHAHNVAPAFRGHGKGAGHRQDLAGPTASGKVAAAVRGHAHNAAAAFRGHAKDTDTVSRPVVSGLGLWLRLILTTSHI